MALTRIREPFEWNPVYNPIIYELESTYSRYFLTSAFTINTIADENGFQLIETSTNHGREVGDVVVVTNNSNEILWISTVTSVPNLDEMVIDKDYESSLGSGATFVYGYAANYRASIQVHAILPDGDTVIATVRQMGTLVGNTPTFQFDVSQILADYINANQYDVHSLTAQGLTENVNSYLKFYIAFAEEYDIGDNGETVYTNFDYETDENASYETNYRWCNNSAFQYDELIGASDKLNGYLVQSSQTDTKFLTDMPSGVVPLKPDQFAFLYFLISEENPDITYSLKITTKNAQGATIEQTIFTPDSYPGEGDFSLLMSYAGMDTAGAKTVCAQLFHGGIIGDGIQAANVINDGGFTEWGGGGMAGHSFTPGQMVYVDIVDQDVPGYEGAQEVLSITGSTITTDRTFTGSLPGDPIVFIYLFIEEENLTEELCWLVDTDCDRYEYQMVFLNKKGGYDTFNFIGKADRSLKVNREGDIKYQLLPDSFVPSNRQFASLRINSRQRIKITHNEKNATVYDWLTTTLLESQDIYLLEEGILLPVNLLTETVVTFTDGAKLNVLEFDFEFAYERVTQTR